MNAIFNINDFRLPEEVEYAEAFQSHPSLKKLKKKIPQIIPEEESEEFQSLLNFLNKNARNITKSTTSDIFKNSILSFGQKMPKYEIFAIKNWIEEIPEKSIRDENAMGVGGRMEVVDTKVEVKYEVQY